MSLQYLTQTMAKYTFGTKTLARGLCILHNMSLRTKDQDASNKAPV
jgi:hypothetical protein